MRVWGVTDGSAGMVAQIQALSVTLGITPHMKRITLKAFWARLPNTLYAYGLTPWVVPHALAVESELLTPPWPNLIISCGRKGAIVALGLRAHIAKYSDESPRLVHIGDPYVDPRHFSAVIAMAHDAIQGANVIKTRYALHAVTPEALAEAKLRFAPQFAVYRSPRLAVLLGGSTNKYSLSASSMRIWLASLQNIRSYAGALLITPSRRTGEDNIAMLRREFAQDTQVYIYDGKGDNPYMGLLALADAIVVTDDSVNMMSEAVATGKPVYILPLPHHKHTKPTRFAERLIKEGMARHFDGRLDGWQYPVPRQMQELPALLNPLLQ